MYFTNGYGGVYFLGGVEGTYDISKEQWKEINIPKDSTNIILSDVRGAITINIASEDSSVALIATPMNIKIRLKITSASSYARLGNGLKMYGPRDEMIDYKGEKEAAANSHIDLSDVYELDWLFADQVSNKNNRNPAPISNNFYVNPSEEKDVLIGTAASPKKNDKQSAGKLVASKPTSKQLNVAAKPFYPKSAVPAATSSSPTMFASKITTSANDEFQAALTRTIKYIHTTMSAICDNDERAKRILLLCLLEQFQFENLDETSSLQDWASELDIDTFFKSVDVEQNVNEKTFSIKFVMNNNDRLKLFKKYVETFNSYIHHSGDNQLKPTITITNNSDNGATAELQNVSCANILIMGRRSRLVRYAIEFVEGSVSNVTSNVARPACS